MTVPTMPAEPPGASGLTPVPDRDRGALTVALMMLLAVTLAGAGLVVDGGRVMVARRHASNVAEAAARAGVSTADPMTPLNPYRVRAVVHDYAADAGIAPADVRVDVGVDWVKVRITERRRTVFLVLGGRGTVTVRASGLARLTWTG